MIHRRWSLRFLIGGTYFCIMAVILGALGLYFSQQTTKNYTDDKVRTVFGLARLGANLLKTTQESTLSNLRTLTTEDKRKLWGILRHIHTSAMASRVMLLDRDGMVLIDSLTPISPERNQDVRGSGLHADAVRKTGESSLDGSPSPSAASTGTNNWALTPEVQQLLHGKEQGQDIRFSDMSGGTALFAAVPILSRTTLLNPFFDEDRSSPEHKFTPASRPSSLPTMLAILVLEMPTNDMDTAVSNMRTAIALAFVGAILVLIFINLGVSSLISQPLATLSSAAERFAHGHLHEHVEPNGAVEISSLGDSFNHMAAQLRVTITRLAEERARAEAMLTSMVDGVLVTDTEGKILLMNRSAEQMFALREASVVGKTLAEVVFQYELYDLWQKTLASGLPMRHEITFTLPIERIMAVHIAPVEVEQQQLGVVIVLYDITNHRKLEQVRRDFVANVSHELRTPVTSIRAMAETLFEAGVDDTELAMEFLQTIIGESERLTALLDDLLQLSRVESGRQLLVLEELDLCAEIRHVTERVIAPITAKQQQLHLELPDSLWLVSDRDAIIQVMVNLLDNAQKYSPEGGTITVCLEQDTWVHIHVLDTGVGIPQADLQRIFERFYRVDKARSRAEKGTGLGLAIVKHLMELLGGTIHVRSEVGVGSCFTVDLPLKRPATSPEEAGELHSGDSVTSRARYRCSG